MKSIFQYQILSRVCVLFLVVLFWSCDVLQYENTETSYTEIDRSNIHNPIIEFFETQDSVLLWGEASIILKSDRKIFYYNAYLNGVFIGSASNYPRYDLDTRSYADGYYTLKFDILLSTGTNSLADKMDLESIQISREKVIEIDNSSPTAVELFEPTWQNEYVKLNWSQNSDKNFQHYVVTRYNRYYGGIGIDTLAYITDQSVLSFTDSSVYPIYGINLGYYKILTVKHTGFRTSDEKYLKYGTPIQPFSHQYVSKPVPSKDGEEIYVYDNYYADIVAISVNTDQVLRRSPYGYSYFPSQTISKDGNTLIVLSDVYDEFYLLNASDFNLIKIIEPGNPVFMYEGPIHAVRNNLVCFSYKQAYISGTYLLNTTTENESLIMAGGYSEKFTSTSDGNYLFVLKPSYLYDIFNLYKYEIIGDSAVQLNSKILSDHRYAINYELQLENDDRIFLLRNYNSIDIIDAEDLNIINTIVIPEIIEQDYICDFYVSNSSLYIAFSERKSFDWGGNTFGKLAEYSLQDYSKINEWHFQNVPRTIITDANERFLYAVTGGAYKISIGNSD